nr:sulfite exporter TauE/SafE family protein [Candidatus Bathyarchaeota archaeon]
TLAGAYIGARLIRHVRGDDLKKIYVIVLLVLGLRMILSGVGV